MACPGEGAETGLVDMRQVTQQEVLATRVGSFGEGKSSFGQVKRFRKALLLLLLLLLLSRL